MLYVRQTAFQQRIDHSYAGQLVKNPQDYQAFKNLFPF